MTTEIRSPMPGVFYRKPSPDEPNFKEVGDAVNKGDVVGLVEVMKTFHQIVCDVDGVIDEYVVDQEDAIMAGQVLLTVK